MQMCSCMRNASRCGLSWRGKLQTACHDSPALQILKLQAENDSLKIQEIEDRRRIQHLLALTQPVAQEVRWHERALCELGQLNDLTRAQPPLGAGHVLPRLSP